MLVVEVRGDEVLRRLGGQAAVPLPPPAASQPSGEAGAATPAGIVPALEDWAQRYARAAAAGAEPALRRIGEEIFDWLAQDGGLRDWLAAPERALEVRVEPTQTGALVEAVLALPWELLCRAGLFLAEDVRSFVIARRCGGSGEPLAPRHADVALMFMAAAPEGHTELDHEAEEAAILEATQARGDRPPLAHVEVEESGGLDLLAERLRFDGPFEVLHLSCHGDIMAEDGAAPRPVLMFEKAEGGGDAVDPDRLIRKFPGDDRRPPLVFVSACRTAERGHGRKEGAPRAEGWRDISPELRDAGAGDGTGATPELAEPFVRRLAAHVPNVLGWDGSVYDADASLFAEVLYGSSRGASASRWRRRGRAGRC